MFTPSNTIIDLNEHVIIVLTESVDGVTVGRSSLAFIW